MSSAYSQAEYLATSTRQVEIPPTTPEHYITGIYALNLAAPEGTSGYWYDNSHWQDGTEQPPSGHSGRHGRHRHHADLWRSWHQRGQKSACTT